MSQWTLGEVRISKRVSVKVEIECGGALEPAELIRIARLLDWIGRATRKWQGGVRQIMPAAKVADVQQVAQSEGASAASRDAPLWREGEAAPSADVRANGDVALQEARQSEEA